MATVSDGVLTPPSDEAPSGLPLPGGEGRGEGVGTLDNVGSRWNTTFAQLISAGVLAMSDGYRAKNDELGGDGLPFLRAGYVSDLQIDLSNPERFRSELTSKLMNKTSAPGDVVITTKGNSTGRVAFISDDLPQSVYSPHLTFWRSLRPDVLVPGFLRAWSRGVEFLDQLRAMSTSTDMAPYLSLIDQRRLHITIPPLPEQRAIAAVLGALDDKIELNRRMNRTLEELARAIFRSWFVDFDPVRAKAAGRAPVGMDAETAALFPAGFEKSELGLIPEGWRVGTLGEIVDVNPSRSLKKGEVAPYLDMGSMPTAGHRAIEWYDRAFGSGSRFVNGDTLLARITPCLENGKTAFVDFLEDSQVGWGSTEYIVLRSKAPYPPTYAYLVARDDAFRDHAIQSMTGSSGRQRVQAAAVSTYPLVVPPSNIASAFGVFAQQFFSLARCNAKQSSTLSATRDYLLPKLLSGEVRVGDAFGRAPDALTPSPSPLGRGE